ncbi:hypothetical protein TKK_0010448 [Trichogramma kaykai]|uniref:MRH domain-containing protein n=1 Tax=Trichogramma kaykai TaxID=54128 RepID=A0ABD2WYD5_9HYME
MRWKSYIVFLIILIIVAETSSIIQHPATLTKKTHYCDVWDSQSNRFNFSLLTNNTHDYKIQHDRGTYLRIQMCNQLVKRCKGEEGYSICLSRKSQEIGIGREPPEVVHEYGSIIFKYTGEECRNGAPYTAKIKMICDFKEDQIELFPAEQEGCNFIMEWRTHAACSSRIELNCTYTDKFNYYDLSHLKNLSDNYEVQIDDRYTIILNVCHSILYGPNLCISNSAACLIDNKNQKFKSLGKPVENPKYNENKTLTLKYFGGSICPTGSDMETTIYFICDMNAVGSTPTYVNGLNKCNFELSWKTPAACSIEVLQNQSIVAKNNDCIIKNPINHEIYNLTSLMNHDYTIEPFGINTFYKFSICGPIKETNCLRGTGACRIHSSQSGGMANSKLLWKDTGVYLNYTDGSECPYDKSKRYTIIEFYCGDQFDIEVDMAGACIDVIKISTELVCEKKSRACATYNREMNFRQLIRRIQNEEIHTNDSIFYINVCKAILPVSIENIKCQDGAGICKLDLTRGKPSKSINLGYPDPYPILTSSYSAVLLYSNGSICERNQSKRINSRISFLCDINSNEGSPIFIKYEDCTYNFEWKTSIVCGKKVDGQYNKNCTISNNHGDIRSLLPLITAFDNQIIEVKNFKKDNKYSIDLCGNKSKCNGSFICDNNKNYGTQVNVDFNYLNNVIRFTFTNGSYCDHFGYFYRSTITIVCDKTSISKIPQIIYEEPCYVEFEWHTDKICKYIKDYSVKSSKPITTISIVAPSKTTTISGNFVATIVSLILIFLGICFYFKDASRRAQFVELLSNSTSRHCDRVRYSVVTTMEEEHLLNDSDISDVESNINDDNDVDDDFKV